MRLTLSQAKSTIARVLGYDSSDSRVITYLNEATQRLMYRGNWRGTIHRYRVCLYQENSLTWPRQIESILKCSVCSEAIPIANKWYEFSQVGPGILHEDEGPGLVLLDMGEACSFNDINVTTAKLHVISSESEDSDAEILLRGYDDSNSWVRTSDSGTLVDGEYVSISAAGATSTTTFSNFTAAIKPATNGTVSVYQYDTATGVYTPLAHYEHDETVPMYRRSRIPALADVGECADCDCCSDGYTKVNVLAKLKYIPAASDNDILLISNLPALKDMVMSIVKSEQFLGQESEYYERRAIRELEKELVNYNGGATIPQLDFQNPELFGAGSITNPI